MKRVRTGIALAFSLGAMIVYAGVQFATSREQHITVAGLQKIVFFNDDAKCFRDNTGCAYQFKSTRNFNLASYFSQTHDVFRGRDESDKEIDLEYDWGGVWKEVPGNEAERRGSAVIFGQYDFDGSKPDSFVIASGREDNGLTTCGVNIYKLKDDKWRLAGVLKAVDVLGPCEIEFKLNKVTIKRHLRGFFYQLTFQNGNFETTSDN